MADRKRPAWALTPERITRMCEVKSAFGGTAWYVEHYPASWYATEIGARRASRTLRSQLEAQMAEQDAVRDDPFRGLTE